jgi:23S rRNA (adenine2503-C2)-methyltransferase
MTWPDHIASTSALELDCRSFVAKHGSQTGPDDARRAYRDLFRTGKPGVAAPIARLEQTDSPEGVVTKFTQKLPGGEGEGVESVLVPMVGQQGTRTHTLCVSSQIGCAMGCAFCQTAVMGRIRSLTAAEIVGQWYAARHELGLAVHNVVFMGMGEPLDNLDAVLGAIGVLTDHDGPAIAMKNITVSTVGRIEGLARLGERIRRPGWHRLGVSISLNAPNDEVRSRIMPINRAEPMAELRRAMLELPRFGQNRLSIGYVLIPGVNNEPDHADQLADYLRPLRERVLVNVIPYNPIDGSLWPAPDEAGVRRFIDRLAGAGYLCKRRRTKGRDVMAGCGQLGGKASGNRHQASGLHAAHVSSEIACVPENMPEPRNTRTPA